MDWFNPPAHHEKRSVEGREVLTITTRPETDFWRSTHYGFIRDTGHLGYVERVGDFTAQVQIRGNYEVLYDQAGLMVRKDERTWIKAGIEYTDGVAHLSVVVTNEFSDWSVIPVPELAEIERSGGGVELRMTRQADAVRIEYRLLEPGSPIKHWQMVRLAHLAVGPSDMLKIGVMACSPQRTKEPGFVAEFNGFAVGDAIAKDLHTGA
jgi:regulation of enolase protein 1 (concanavalin A-like superfamily)